MKKHVLLVTIGYSPNIGGIETHFDDLVKALVERKWKVSVLTYMPLTSKKNALFFEQQKYLKIIRLPVLRGLFYKLIKNPVIEFLYLFPGLFIVLPFILLFDEDINIIHSHGLVAGFVSVFWGKIFEKRVVTTTHSIYNFPKEGAYKRFARWIFENSNTVLCLSDQSVNEIKNLGVSPKKVKRFTYWVDLKKFSNIANAKEKLCLQKKFVVLFVGRLVPEKGINVLLKSLNRWPKGGLLLVVGVGPLESEVRKSEKKFPERTMYVGVVSQQKLPMYYSAADVLIVPSIHEEGFGRVILESLACGTPVIGANRGAIPEALDTSVGKLIDISHQNIIKAIKSTCENKELLKKMGANARKFAEKKYSEKNVETIVQSYLT